MTDPGNAIPGVLILGGNYGSLAAARSLGRKGIKVAFLGDPLAVAAFSRYLTHFAAWRGVAELDPLARILEFGRSNGLGGWVILPSADFETQFVASHLPQLSGFFRVATQDWSTLAQLHDKRLLYRLAESLDIDFPKVYPPDADPSELLYPVVIKPGLTRLHNALTVAKVWRADSAAQFTDMRAEAGRLMGDDGFVVQQLIPGDGQTQYSYAGLWDRGQEVRGMTALRLRQFPLHFGTSPYVESVVLPRAAQEAQRLLGAMNYSGLVEVEFKHDLRDDQLKLLDANTRIWAWIGLGDAVGVDFPYLCALQASSGTLPAAAPLRYGPAWRRSVPNLLSSLHSLLKEGNPGLSAARSIFRPACSAVFAADDLWPAMTEIPVQAARKLKNVLGR